eukprot:13959677-Ditylum_brightwellii.AAC.1
MRVLKNNFMRYMDVDEETINEEEFGWKLILFASAIGTGTHLMTATMIILTLVLTGFLSITVRSSLPSGSVVTYCLTFYVSGYVAIRLNLQMKGKNWVRSALLIATFYPIVFMWVNSVTLAKQSTSALPFGMLFTNTCLYCLLCLPPSPSLEPLPQKNYAKKGF